MEIRLLVNAKIAAQWMSISERKLWGMTFEESPAIPHVRVGRLVRYCPDDLQKFIADHRKGGSDESE